MVRAFAPLALIILLSACSNQSAANKSAETTPDDTQAPATFRVRMETSKGPVVIEATRAWAPKGVDRFYMLTKRGFYNEARFFRVVPGFVVQFGMHAKPEENAKWTGTDIPDDLVTTPNSRGTVAFASAGPNTRTTQLFINLVDNSQKLDARGFSVIGRVVEGMDVIDKINPEYGQEPVQDLISLRGNEYLKEQFPRLDYIQKMTIVP